MAVFKDLTRLLVPLKATDLVPNVELGIPSIPMPQHLRKKVNKLTRNTKSERLITTYEKEQNPPITLTPIRPAKKTRVKWIQQQVINCKYIGHQLDKLRREDLKVRSISSRSRH